MDSGNNNNHNRDRKKGQKTITVDQKQLREMLETLAGKVATMGQLGQDWEQLCTSVNESLSQSIDKSTTLNKKLKHMKKEQSMSITR